MLDASKTCGSYFLARKQSSHWQHILVPLTRPYISVHKFYWLLTKHNKNPIDRRKVILRSPWKCILQYKYHLLHQRCTGTGTFIDIKSDTRIWELRDHLANTDILSAYQQLAQNRQILIMNRLDFFPTLPTHLHSRTLLLSIFFMDVWWFSDASCTIYL